MVECWPKQVQGPEFKPQYKKTKLYIHLCIYSSLLLHLNYLEILPVLILSTTSSPTMPHVVEVRYLLKNEVMVLLN
jgi:hypothetical protein